MMDRGLRIVATLALILFTVELVASQERTTDQVAVTVSILRDQVVAVTAGEGLVSVGLTSDDRLLGIEARGLNALVVTSTRLLAFSAFTGGFFIKDLSTEDPVIETTVNDNIVILSTVNRRLIFRSQLAAWAELR